MLVLPQHEMRCWVLQVYFILELAELTKLSNKQGGERYRREHKATLELANAVGRKTRGNGPNALTKGCVVRLQQLSDKGYLAVKRQKGDKQQHKPAPYPGHCFASLRALDAVPTSWCCSAETSTACLPSWRSAIALEKRH